VELWINNPVARINDLPLEMDTPPAIINSRTLVPVRFVSQALGAKVDWDPTFKTVTITR